MRKGVPAVVVVVSLFFHVSAFAEQPRQGYIFSQYDVPITQGAATSLFDLDKGGRFIGIYFGDRLHAFGFNQRDQAFTSYNVGNNSINFVTAISDTAIVGSTEQADGRRVGTVWPRKSSSRAWKKILGPFVAAALSDQGPILIDIENYRSTALLGINDRGHLVGAVQKPDFTFRGFVIVEGQISIFDYPEAQSTQAEGISKDGTIVGTYMLNNTSHGFLLHPNGQFEAFGVPNACETFISDINDAGDFAGTYIDCGSRQMRGYVLTRKRVLTPIIYPGVGTTATQVFGLDEKGNVAGRFDDATGRHGFLGLLK
jgi:hypothetical protein